MKLEQPTTFRLYYSNISKLSPEDAINKIKSSGKIQLGHLKLFDLILENDGPTSIWNGVYSFFSEKNECLYVGKNSAQNFNERIPWHFTLNENGWMNHFIKRFRDLKDVKTLGEAALEAKKCNLLLIPVGNGNLIKPLEKFLRIFLEPKLNTYSQPYRTRHKHFLEYKTLYDVLTKF